MNARRLFHVLGLMVLLGLAVVPIGSAQSRPGAESNPIGAAFQSPESSGSLLWHAFLGGTAWDEGGATTVDATGNIYVCGSSGAAWGIPIHPFTGVEAVFVAKLNSSGALVWNTFMPGSSYWGCGGVAVDGNGNVYIAGTSWESWGNPVNPFEGGEDAYVAKLNKNGVLLWNTFLGGYSTSDCSDIGRDIAVDGSGNVYLVGHTWYYGNWDTCPEKAFVARLDGSSGALVWATILAAPRFEVYGNGIVVDENIYITGSSAESWGTPVRPHAGYYDAFIAKLNNAGALLWNTFLGGNRGDGGSDIAVDGSGNLYVTGSSDSSWGTPINPGKGAFVARLNPNGVLVWNTFLGGSSGDVVNTGIALDGSGNLYVTGYSWTTWGTPVRPFAGGRDAFAARLDNRGALLWNTFLGGSNDDSGNGIAVDSGRNLYVIGTSYAGWGTPLDPYAGVSDAFVARLDAGQTSSSRAFRSLGVHDGWVLESTGSSNAGGTLNSNRTTFVVGDDASDRQFRSILSFDTSTLPDNAVIARATLWIKRANTWGTDPFTTHGGLKVDIRKPYFGPSAALAASDFQAVASRPGVATFNRTPSAAGWQLAALSEAAYPYINRTGTTQFRLRFWLDDNDDMSADGAVFYSGNALTVTDRPRLAVQYYVP